MEARRAFVIVLDSVGCGALPDAASYGDEGANTLGHIAQAAGGLNLANLAALGLGRACTVPGIRPEATETLGGGYGRMAEVSAGKDTTTGHWELMGLPVLTPFPTYPRGFPPEVMSRFVEVTGHGWIGNEPASGTEIIDRLGATHVESGKLIVYTSADSVFQIAAHEDVVSVEELYRVCELARTKVLVGDHAVARVIARPFVGDPAQGFRRTSRRHDYSLAPTGATALDVLREHGVPVYGIGKISDIYAGRGITLSQSTESNDDGMDKVLRLADEIDFGLVFVNLVDFDMLWGHRRDAQGYARGLEVADARIGELLAALRDDDLLIVTADHGCDPTLDGSDHTREYVPLLVTTGARIRESGGSVDLGTRNTFSDVAATVLDWFGVDRRHRPSRLNDGTKEYGWVGASVLPLVHVGATYRPATVEAPSGIIAIRSQLHPLLRAGEELYLVGGALRDALMGAVAPSPDLDIVLVGDLNRVLDATSDSPHLDVASCNTQLRTAKLTLHLPGGGESVSFDIAESRAESYGEGSAYPQDTIGAPIEWDLARRDFSVNALAVPLDDISSEDGSFELGSVIDLFGGIADVRARVLRVLHDGSFADDPTRIVRLMRFSRRLEMIIEPHTLRLASDALAAGFLTRVAPRQLEREIALLDREWKDDVTVE